MKKFVEVILILFIFLLCSPLNLFAAEILQVRTSSLFQIGDRNRSYTVKLSCVDIDASSEEMAVKWLRLKLPRRSKINLRPERVDDGILFSKIYLIDSNEDIALQLSLEGLANYTC